MYYTRKIIQLLTGWIIYIFLVTLTLLIYDALYTGAGLLARMEVDTVMILFSDLLIFTVTGFIIYSCIIFIFHQVDRLKDTELGLFLNMAIYYVLMVSSFITVLSFEMDMDPFATPIEIGILFAIALVVFASIPYFKKHIFTS